MQEQVLQELRGIAKPDNEHAIYYLRWENAGKYLQVSVDHDGKVSLSTNLGQHVLGKGLAWPELDERYKADLVSALGGLYDSNIGQ